MQNLLFPAGRINIEDMYIRVYAEKPSYLRRMISASSGTADGLIHAPLTFE